MDTQTDYKELLALFNKHDVRYLIVGGYALAFHGAPRFTGDLDLWVALGSGNAKRIVAALDEFGFGSLGLTEEDFQRPENVVQLGVQPVRIDLLTSISGVTWDQAYRNRIEGSYGDVPAFFIGIREFKANKKATGRRQDLADIDSIDALTKK